MQRNKNPKKTTNYTTMKKLLLLLAGCLLAGSAAFAQEETTPGWKIVANCLEPSGIETIEYVMTESETTKANATSNVFFATVDLPVYPEHSNPKPSKYQFVITYTDATGAQKTKTHQIIRQIADGDIKITLSAWLDKDGNIVSYDSTATYLLCDSNWTGFSYLAPSIDGEKDYTYFNARANNIIAAMRGLNLGSSTVEFLAGNNSTYDGIFIPNKNVTMGVNVAEFDYNTSTITISPATEMKISIGEALPFVSAVDVTLPEGVTAYKYSSLEEDNLYVGAMESNIIPANTPVILKASSKGEYTLGLDTEFKAEAVASGSRYIIADVKEEGSTLYGVHYPHTVTPEFYVFNGEKFIPGVNNDIINPFNCYLKPDDANVESISIVFPEEEEQDGITVNLGSDTTNQSGTIKDNDINITTVGEGALVYVEVGADVYAIYYYIAEEEVDVKGGEEEDLPSGSYAGKRRVLPDGASYTEAIVNNGVVTIPLVVGSGQLHIATSADGDNEQVFTYTVAKGVPTAVEAVETASDENGAIYNIFGQKVDASYNGIVIKNGKKFIQR